MNFPYVCNVHIKSYCFNLILGCNSQSQDKVDQHTRIQSAFEDDTVTINCTYQTTYTNPLFWYQQKGNGNPKHMLNKFSKSGNNLRVSDSAVYYCALMPTAKRPLGFGYGSRVVVKVGAEHRDYAVSRLLL
uniref:Immunoglobulin domain-containing protein n=1 Tax=Cyprinus carpio TaxID=7962 RepID=A0A8C1TCZ1_CYPCA